MEHGSFAFVADRELIETLETRSKPVPCNEDSVLFRQGETPKGLYILRNGEALLTMKSKAGKEVMCFHVAPGSLLGLPGIIGNAAYTLTATARKGSEVKFIARRDFENLMLAEPAMSFKVLQVLATEVRSARKALAEK